MKAVQPAADQSTMIILPANVDFKKLVQDSINQITLNSNHNSTGKTQADKHALSTGKLKVLNTITASEIALLAAALQVAATDGLTQDELNSIIGDLHDLVKHGSTTKDFAKLIANPVNPKYKLTEQVQKVLIALSPEDKQTLAKDLHSQHESAGQKILNFLTHTTEQLLPTLAIITDHIIKVGMPLLDGVIVKLVPGSGGALIKMGLDSAAGMVTKVIEQKMADTHLTDEQKKVAATVEQGINAVTPLAEKVIAEQGGSAGATVAKALDAASKGVTADLHVATNTAAAAPAPAPAPAPAAAAEPVVVVPVAPPVTPLSAAVVIPPAPPASPQGDHAVAEVQVAGADAPHTDVTHG
jgi:hypothetical protein